MKSLITLLITIILAGCSSVSTNQNIDFLELPIGTAYKFPRCGSNVMLKVCTRDSFQIMTDEPTWYFLRAAPLFAKVTVGGFYLNERMVQYSTVGYDEKGILIGVTVDLERDTSGFRPKTEPGIVIQEKVLAALTTKLGKPTQVLNPIDYINKGLESSFKEREFSDGAKIFIWVTEKIVVVYEGEHKPKGEGSVNIYDADYYNNKIKYRFLKKSENIQ